MTDLRELANRVARAFQKRSENHARASLIFKSAFAALSAASVIAQFTAAESLTASNYVGIGTAAAAALVALYLAITDTDAATELETAREAVVLAQEAKEELDGRIRALNEYEAELEK